MKNEFSITPANLLIATARQANRLQQEHAARIQLGLEDNLEELLAEEALEGNDDADDSEATQSSGAIQNPFDVEWSLGLPLEKQLSHRLRPPVRYLLDRQFQVHQLDRQIDTASNLSYLIAAAIARHIENCGTTLENVGDWQHIPKIGADEALLKLMIESALATGKSQQLLVMKLEKLGGAMKAFAILLPNGDIVAAQALIEGARKGKRATRAGALRYRASGGDAPLSGEEWLQDDWAAMVRSEDAARTRARLSSNAKTPKN